MTDRAAPGAKGSTVRNVEYGEMSGRAVSGYVQPSNDPTTSLVDYRGWKGIPTERSLTADELDAIRDQFDTALGRDRDSDGYEHMGEELTEGFGAKHALQGGIS